MNTLIQVADPNGERLGQLYVPTVKLEEFKKALLKRGCHFIEPKISVIEDPEDLPSWCHGDDY